MKIKLWTVIVVFVSMPLMVACSGGGDSEPSPAVDAAAQAAGEGYAQTIHSAFKPGLDDAFTANTVLAETNVKGAKGTSLEVIWELNVTRPSGTAIESRVTKIVEALGGEVTFHAGGGGGGGAVIDFKNLPLKGFTISGTLAQPPDGSRIVFSGTVVPGD